MGGHKEKKVATLCELFGTAVKDAGWDGPGLRYTVQEMVLVDSPAILRRGPVRGSKSGLDGYGGRTDRY